MTAGSLQRGSGSCPERRGLHGGPLGGEGRAVPWLFPSRHSLGGGRQAALVCECDSPWGGCRSPLAICRRTLAWNAHAILSLRDTGHLEPHGLCRLSPTPLLELGSLQRGPSSSTDSGQTGCI